MSIKVKKQQKQTMEEKLNTLRAGVLGSNDGILTVVGVLVSVAAATSDRFTIFIAACLICLLVHFQWLLANMPLYLPKRIRKKRPLLKKNSS